MSLQTCSLDINVTLPLVCVCSLFSFLCGVGIGGNDLSANFAMVVGSGSLNMKQAIIYCTVFELLGAAFMGGHVSSTIRNGIVEPILFNQNRDLVVVGMTCASFAAALWLYLSTVFGLPVSITHTVVGSLLGFAIFSKWSFSFVKARGIAVIVISWVAAPVAACVVTALLFYAMRRDIFHVKGRSFELALRALPYCLALSLLVDFCFIAIERPPIMSVTFAQYVPLWAQFTILLLAIFVFCAAVKRWVFPRVAEAAMEASSFVWESGAIRTERVELPPEEVVQEEEKLIKNISFFKMPHPQQQKGSDQPALAATPSAGSIAAATAAGAATSSAAAPDLRGSTSIAIEHSGLYTPPCTPSPNAFIGAASIVMSSINPADGSIVQRSSVRLAPVPSSTGRRSPFPTDLAESTSTSTYRHFGTAGEMREFSVERTGAPVANYGATSAAAVHSRRHQDGAAKGAAAAAGDETAVVPSSPSSVYSTDEFGEEDWLMDHPMEPIRFGGLLIKPFNPRAEYLFTGLQVVAGSMSSFVHGAVAGANATATFVILYEAFTNHELGEKDLSTRWSVMPAMLGIAIGMFALGATLMKTVGMELVTVTPARGWCIQVGGTLVTMVLTGLGIPVSLSQSQVGAAIGCGVLDAKLKGVSWPLVGKIVGGWIVTLAISACTTGLAMWCLGSVLC